MPNLSLLLLLLPCLWAQPESSLRRAQQAQPKTFATNLALGQYLPCMLDQFRPALGQRQPPRGTVEQRGADLHFQTRDGF